MSNRMTAFKLAAAAASLAWAGHAQATLTVFTTQASFMAAVAALGLSTGTDTFDDLAFGATPGPLLRSAGSIGYEASIPSSGSFSPAGSVSDVWLAPAAAASLMVFSQFDSGVQAIGGSFFTTDADGEKTSSTRVTVTAVDGNSTLSQGFAGLVPFVGFVSDGPLTSLTVFTPAASTPRFPAVNNLVLAVAVPEPETYLMMLGGLAALGFIARRRRSRD